MIRDKNSSLRPAAPRLALACLALAVFASCASSPKVAAPSAPAPAKASANISGRVAVFDFEVKGGGEVFESLRGDLPDSLSEIFIKGGRLVPVERSSLEKLVAEQELGLSGSVDESTAARVGRLAGARYALLGSASILGDQVRLSCRLIDIETGEILYAESAHGEAKSAYSVLEELAKAVENGLSK
jgi:curli biogenesis system outer membrane secretion channel CsgG